MSSLKKIPFNTTQSDLLTRNGQDFEVVRPLKPGSEYDYEGTLMFEIRFSDGSVIHAFEDEIFDVDDTIN